MRLEQRMKLAPRMIQSMEILQLASQALEERIEQELTSNPTLELREAGPDAQDVEAQVEQEKRDSREGEREMVVDDTPTAQDGTANSTNADDFERLTNISEEYSDSWDSNTYETGESFSYRRRGDDGERDAKLDAMANTASRPESLAEQLMGQWHLTELPPDATPEQARALRTAGEIIIEHLDDDGYLRMDLAELVKLTPNAGITVEVFEQALRLIQQSLEPVGIGARDLRECLLLQIDAKMRQEPERDLTVERLLVSDYLKDIENNRLPRIAKAAGVSVEAVNEAKLNLRMFYPHPGRLLETSVQHRITPDAVIEFDDEHDRYTARLSHDRLPSVQINPRYLKMLRDAQLDRKTKDFVSNNLRSARWLLDAIEQRHHTLLRVINVVIEAQREFFDLGPQHLKPLPMTTVADQLGIHVATVSRAVNEKYIQTPRGIFPLRMFFSGGTETQAGDAMSWAAVQAKLQEIIDGEDKSNPLSDDELVDKLKEKGIEIARRTVAKYRKQMNIPPARQRRRY